MRHLWLIVAAALVACAPGASNPDRTGRIVNVQTGAEGRITLGGGGVVEGQGRATIAFGQDVYYGEYNVLGAGFRSALVLNAGVAFGSDPFFDPTPWPQTVTVRDNAPRQGSIIVKNAHGAVITCTLTADLYGHGNASCEDGAGQKYAAQF